MLYYHARWFYLLSGLMNLIHKSMSVLLISMILWAGVAHADHASLSVSAWETQDCKLCQHNLDSPNIPAVLIFDSHNVNEQSAPTYVSADSSAPKYLLASHRAPPHKR